MQDNEYMEAIKSMGAILSHYDLEQCFPAFGFGAKPPMQIFQIPG